ncbi:hypothetical protein N7530_009800 [Penicillium desertorum]|uniref:Uncharacterized protein n=1 Tax=Penicillium desertorum TaxID=1303715 RepID=A0A9W9WJ57_9EURO|nr:hypothetical protein N7530_009800 [Penicillium desertorum]
MHHFPWPVDLTSASKLLPIWKLPLRPSMLVLSDSGSKGLPVVYWLETSAAYCVGAWWHGLAALANIVMTDRQRASVSPRSL